MQTAGQRTSTSEHAMRRNSGSSRGSCGQSELLSSPTACDSSGKPTAGRQQATRQPVGGVAVNSADDAAAMIDSLSLGGSRSDRSSRELAAAPVGSRRVHPSATEAWAEAAVGGEEEGHEASQSRDRSNSRPMAELHGPSRPSASSNSTNGSGSRVASVAGVGQAAVIASADGKTKGQLLVGGANSCAEVDSGPIACSECQRRWRQEIEASRGGRSIGAGGTSGRGRAEISICELRRMSAIAAVSTCKGEASGAGGGTDSATSTMRRRDVAGSGAGAGDTGQGGAEENGTSVPIPSSFLPQSVSCVPCVAGSGDVFLCAKGRAYRIPHCFLSDHPGGVKSIVRHAGQICDTDFDFHSPQAQKAWAQFEIGRLLPCAGLGTGRKGKDVCGGVGGQGQNCTIM